MCIRDSRVAAQQIDRLLDRGDAVGQAEMRRVDDFQQGAGQTRVLADQPGDAAQIRVGHDLLHLQVDHDLRLRRYADALQDLLNLLGGEFVGHGSAIVQCEK